MTTLTKAKPIRTDDDLAEALATIDALWGAAEGSEAGDLLEVLTVLVEDYERIHYPVDPPTPAEAIRFRMEQQGYTRKDLEEVLGSRSRVSEVLSGKRPLSVEMMRALHQRWGISAEVLLAKKA